jgi:two-component system OmpR family response regulator
MSAKRILVIDDEPNVIRLCQQALGREGFVVKGALRGEEGLQLLKEEGFDLILLDVRLPDRDGLDVLSAIRQTDPEVPVIIITAHDTMEVTARLLKSEAQDLLLKPFTLEELVNSAQKVLERDV